MPRKPKEPKEPKEPKPPREKKKKEKPLPIKRMVIIKHYGDALTDEERSRFIVTFPMF